MKWVQLWPADVYCTLSSALVSCEPLLELFSMLQICSVPTLCTFSVDSQSWHISPQSRTEPGMYYFLCCSSGGTALPLPHFI